MIFISFSGFTYVKGLLLGSPLVESHIVLSESRPRMFFVRGRINSRIVPPETRTHFSRLHEDVE
jgi:hypothetical protein